MANKDKGKSQAEQYREERKERLAKAAKQNGKKSIPELKPVNSKANKAISISILAVAVVAVVGLLLNFFGVPQKMATVMTVGDTKVSQAEYTYYYMSSYNSIVQTANYYDQIYGSSYGAGLGKMMTGFDVSKSPSEQEYSGADMEAKADGSKHTWEDYLRKTTADNLQQQFILCAQAKEAGVTLTDEEIKEIDDQITSLQEQAAQSDYTLNAYLRVAYGKGVDKKLLREAMLERQTANKFAESKKKDMGGAVTEDELQAEYEANKDTYDTATLRYYSFAVTTPTPAEGATDEEKNAAKEQAKADAKAKADAMLGKVTGAESFKEQAKANAAEDKKSTYDDDSATQLKDKTLGDAKSKLSEASANWAFDAARKAGDKTVIETDTAMYVLYLESPRVRNESGTIDVRHILLEYPENATDEQKAEVKQQAEALLQQWKDGEATQDSFAALAKEKSKDTGSAENGGLYEAVPKGQMVAPFENWIYDSTRKPGDTGLVESTYGVHVMYFVKVNDTPKWKGDAKSAIGSKDYDTYLNELKASDTYKVTAKDKKVAGITKKISKDIAANLAMNRSK